MPSRRIGQEIESLKKIAAAHKFPNGKVAEGRYFYCWGSRVRTDGAGRICRNSKGAMEYCVVPGYTVYFSADDVAMKHGGYSGIYWGHREDIDNKDLEWTFCRDTSSIYGKVHSGRIRVWRLSEVAEAPEVG